MELFLRRTVLEFEIVLLFLLRRTTIHQFSFFVFFAEFEGRALSLPMRHLGGFCLINFENSLVEEGHKCIFLLQTLHHLLCLKGPRKRRTTTVSVLCLFAHVFIDHQSGLDQRVEHLIFFSDRWLGRQS